MTKTSASTAFSVSLPFDTWKEIFDAFSDSPSEAIEKLWNSYRELKEAKKR